MLSCFVNDMEYCFYFLPTHFYRKDLKRIKRRLSDGEQKSKSKKRRNGAADKKDNYLGSYVQEVSNHSLLSSNHTPVQQNVRQQSSVEQSVSYQTLPATSPERRHSKRKPATPKKLPDCVQGKVETLARNINSKVCRVVNDAMKCFVFSLFC